MPHKDKEKQRAAWKKYNESIKGKERTKRYLETHESQLAKKRKKKQEKRFEAFCRHHNKHPDIVRRHINFVKGGIDMDSVDPHTAKVVALWQQGERKRKEKQASVRTVDFY